MLARLGKIENIYSIGGTYLQYRWHIFTVSVAHMLQYRWHIFTVSVAHIYSIGGTYLQYRWHIFTVSAAHIYSIGGTYLQYRWHICYSWVHFRASHVYTSSPNPHTGGLEYKIILLLKHHERRIYRNSNLHPPVACLNTRGSREIHKWSHSIRMYNFTACFICT